MLSSAALKEFKDLYFQEFGKKISDQEAVELAISLLTIFDKVYRPIKKSWSEDFEKKSKK